MEVTAAKWQISGKARVGENVENVRTKFGVGNLSKKNGLDNLSYYITDGYANFYFRNNKLVKVNWELNVC